MMMINALLLLSMLSAATALSVRYVPTRHSISYTYSSDGCRYKVYYSHHKKYLYTYETCSSPPSSIEVCLSTLIASIQGSLADIDRDLAENAANIQLGFKSEASKLEHEISMVDHVKGIASAVISHIDVECSNLGDQVKNIQQQKQDIVDIYQNVEAELSNLLLYIEKNNEQRKQLEAEIYSVKRAKWYVQSYLSEIAENKRLIDQQKDVIAQVVSQLYAEAKEIESKISQLNKRQNWLIKWESKLYIGIKNFEEQINSFVSEQKSLLSQQQYLSVNQKQLYIKVADAKECIHGLKSEYYELDEQLKELMEYYSDICSMSNSVSIDASYFINAYKEFTCEESLLNYEACSKSKTSMTTAVGVPKP